MNSRQRLKGPLYAHGFAVSRGPACGCGMLGRKAWLGWRLHATCLVPPLHLPFLLTCGIIYIDLSAIFEGKQLLPYCYCFFLAEHPPGFTRAAIL